MNAICGDGMKDLLSTFTLVGAKCGTVAPDDIKLFLPHRTTVSTDIKKAAKYVREGIQKEIDKVFGINGVGGAMCTDLWTDDHRKISYMCVTLHYVDDNFELHSRIIANRYVETDTGKTWDIILRDLKNIFYEYGLDDTQIKRIIFVTDRGTNIVKALNFYTRLNCMDHFIHKVVEKIMGTGRPREVISACTHTVRYIKKSGLNDCFGYGLKSASAIRWTTNSLMLESIDTNWDKLREILIEHGNISKLQDVTKEEVEQMIDFIDVFSQAILMMEQTKKPTLNYVCMWLSFLDNHIAVNDEDTDLIKTMKENCTTYFASHKSEHTHIFHQIAVFLHPDTRAMQQFTDIEITSVMEKVSVFFFNKTYCI